jgi:NAD+ kinase
MAAVALVVHRDRPHAAELARQTADWLIASGHEVRLGRDDAVAAGLGELGRAERDMTADLDLAVSLGGDGTMLRAVDLVARADVPVMGVNLGQLAYLSEVEPSGVRSALERFLAGDYDIEPRMLVAATIEGDIEAPTGPLAPTAIGLNEIVLEKTESGHTVRLEVEINGNFFTPYTADGLIVATPTGSTAYALSARGPIVEPTHRALLLTPVSPHMLFDRTLVLLPDAVVRLTVAGSRPAHLSVDGRLLGELKAGTTISCTASEHVAKFVVFGPRDFHGILKAKFKLGDR